MTKFRKQKPGDMPTARDWNMLTRLVESISKSLGINARLDSTGLNIRKTLPPDTGYMFIAEVDSDAAGGGYYNCHLQKLDSSDWDTDNSDQLDDVGESVVVLNITEIGKDVHAIAVGEAMLCWKFLDDNSRVRYVGLQLNRRLLFGKPTGAFSSGATITLNPCDIHGTDNGRANIAVYLQASKASYSMTNSTTIPTSQICIFYRADDGNYYLLGTPTEIVTDVDVTGGSKLLQKKTRNAWILTVGTESSNVTVHTGTACP